MLKTYHYYRDYIFIITYQADNPAYMIDFLDIPEIITSGETLAEAFALGNLANDRVNAASVEGFR